jgi:hypothetical protein
MNEMRGLSRTEIKKNLGNPFLANPIMSMIIVRNDMGSR